MIAFSTSPVHNGKTEPKVLVAADAEIATYAIT
jgi:hypothetical protein